jgi:ATP-binding cassette subfamily B multidrug efflux pump
MQEEEILGKAYDHRLMKRLLAYLRPYRWHITLGIALSMVVSAMEAFRPWFVKHAVDVNIARGDAAGLLWTALGLMGLLLVRGLILFGNAYLTQWIGQRTILDLRQQIYRLLQGKGLRYFDRNPIGRLVTRVTNDVEVLNDLFSSGIVMVFTDIFTITGILGFMFAMNWQLSLVSLSVLPFLFYATFLFRRKAREAYRDVRIQLARINSFMQEHITGMTVDQLFGREARALEQFHGINAAHRDANIRSVFYYAVFYPAVELIGAVAIGLILWYAGLGASGVVTLGTVMAFLQFNEMFWRPVRDLSEKYNILQTAMASSERIFKVLDDHTVVPDPAAPAPLSRLRGEIEFENVSFAYNDGEWVLKNVSFRAAPGETVAVVGHTGAGKSSLINLLCRYYEFQQGDIRVDGISIREVAKADLRRQMAVVLQDPFLFSTDLRDNITLERDEVDDGRLQEAVQMVGLDRFIAAMPDGFAHTIRERGAGLSVGQKQLVSFARALAGNPAILILDEATSSVDTETEQLLQEATRTLLRGRTSLVIAHRLSTVQHADRILVLHKGEVRETGTHAELLAHDGIYARLYRLQYRDQEQRPPATSPAGLAPALGTE